MTAVKQQDANPTRKKAAAEQANKQSRTRSKDKGPEILPHLEHFVQLTRRVQRPTLLRSLVEGVIGKPLAPLRELTEDANGSLPIPARNAVFAVVAGLAHADHARIERAAERVNLLCDEYGTLAVGTLLDASNPHDADILESPTDKFSRALYLFMRQDFPAEGEASDDRFDHAERQQEMLRQSQSDRHSSHYIGPKGAQPTLAVDADQALRRRLTELFPKIDPDDILVEHFEHRDPTQAGNPVVLFTLTAKFNGAEVHYQRIANGEVQDVESAAVTDVRYSWKAITGELSVYCDDIEVRPELAALFRDVVLGGDGDIRSMPMREFDLMGFSTPAMLKRFKKDRIEGIDGIEIRHLVVAKPELRQVNLRGKTVERRVENALLIRRHRFEERDIYLVARETHSLPDLTEYAVQQVKLTIRVAKTLHRKAHNVSVQITAPNGFSDSRLTKDDSELVFSQLMRLDCARQY